MNFLTKIYTIFVFPCYSLYPRLSDAAVSKGKLGLSNWERATSFRGGDGRTKRFTFTFTTTQANTMKYCLMDQFMEISFHKMRYLQLRTVSWQITLFIWGGLNENEIPLMAVYIHDSESTEGLPYFSGGRH